MADYADGSMIVNTEIDTEGFLKDSDKLKKAIASLTRQVDSIGQQMKTAIAKNNTAAMETLNRKFQESQAQAEALRSKLEAFARVKILNDEYIRVTNDIQKAEKALERLTERQEKMKAVGANQQFEKWQQLQRDIATTNTQLDEYETKMEAARQKVRELSSPEAYKQLSHASATEIEAHHAALAKAREEYAELSRTVVDLSNKVGDLYEREDAMKASGADKGSAAWRSLQYDIDQTREKLEQLNAQREQMENNGSDSTTGGSTSQFQQLNDELGQTEERLGAVHGSMEEAFSGNEASGFAAVLGNVASKAGHAAASLAKMIGHGVLSFLGKLASGAKNAAIQLAKLASRAIANGIRKIGSLAASAGRSLLSLGSSAKKSNVGLGDALKAMMKYGLGIRSVFMLVRKLRSAVADAFKNMAQKVPEVNQSISSLMSALDRLKNSLATAFQPILTAVAPYLTQLMNMLSNALTKVGEFFAALTGQKYAYKATTAQIDYAKSLDKTSKKAKEAKNQLAGFDQLNILSDSSSDNKTPTSDFEKIPIESKISDFIKRIKDAFNAGNFEEIGHILGEKINEIFRKLDSLIKWENIGATITKYVNLICGVINGLVDSIDWPLIGRTFADGINAIINTLYLLVTGIRWENIGTAIGTALTNMVNNIDWDTLGATLAYWMTTKLRMLTSAVLAFDWEGLGAGLATGLNSFIDVLYEVLSGIDWIGCVEKISAGLNRLISDVDWEGLGDLIGFAIATLLSILTTAITEIDWAGLAEGVSIGFDSIVSKISEAVNGIDWVALGESFVGGLNGLVNDPDWEGFGVTLGELFNGLLSTLLTILTEFDWAGLGTSLADLVMGAVGTIDWAGISETISTAITGVLTAANEFVLGLDPETIVTAVEEYLGGVDWEGIASTLFELLGTALGTLGAVIGGLIRDAFIGIEEYFNEQIEAAGGNVVAGIFNGIINALAGIVTWINDNIFTPFINGFKSVFGIASPSTVMEEMGGYIIEGLKNGISGLWEAVKQFFIDAWENIKTVFTDADIATWFTENVWNKIQGAFDSVGEWFKGIAEEMWSGITGFFTELGEGIGTWFTENVWNKITGAFSGVKEWFTNMASDIWDGLTGGLSDTVEDVKTKVTGFFSNVWGGVLDFFGIHSPSTTASDAAGNLMEGFAQGAEANQESAGERLKNVFSGIYEKAKGVWDSVTGWFSKLFGGGDKNENSAAKEANSVASDIDTAFSGVENSLAQPIEKGSERGGTALETLKTAVSDAASSIKTHLDGIKSSIATTMSAIKSTISTQTQQIQSTVSSGFQNVKNSITTNTSQAMSSVNQQNWSGIGSNIVSGIQQGINNGWGWLQTTVWNLAVSLYNTARNALGIHSPSRLFQEGVGEMLGLGVAEGMKDSEPKILNTVSSVADAMAAEMNDRDIVAQIGARSGRLDDALSSFSNKVSDSFASLIERLEAIADTVAFRMPAVAAGSVVPYSVSAKGEGPFSGVATALEGATEEQTSAMIQMFNNQTTAIVRAIQDYAGADVQIGDNIIGAAAVRYINRTARMTGKSPILV